MYQKYVNCSCASHKYKYIHVCHKNTHLPSSFLILRQNSNEEIKQLLAYHNTVLFTNTQNGCSTIQQLGLHLNLIDSKVCHIQAVQE